MLAALHQVDPEAVGLGGEKETTLTDEIKRWTRAFETVDEQMNARYLEAEELLFATMPEALAEPRSATATTASATCCATAPRSRR